MRQEDSWKQQWLQIIEYMEHYKRCPSKHRVEDHKMLNWIKYNKKLIAKGELSEERTMKFNLILQIATKYRKVNQYAYARHPSAEPDLFESSV